MALSNFEAIKNYCRMGWRSTFAAAMDALGDNFSLGAESGSDAGFTNFNLTTHATDADGVTWTITASNDATGNFQFSMTSAGKGIDDALADPIVPVVQEESV